MGDVKAILSLQVQIDAQTQSLLQGHLSRAEADFAVALLPDAPQPASGQLRPAQLLPSGLPVPSLRHASAPAEPAGEPCRLLLNKQGQLIVREVSGRRRGRGCVARLYRSARTDLVACHRGRLARSQAQSASIGKVGKLFAIGTRFTASLSAPQPPGGLARLEPQPYAGHGKRWSLHPADGGSALQLAAASPQQRDLLVLSIQYFASAAARGGLESGGPRLVGRLRLEQPTDVLVGTELRLRLPCTVGTSAVQVVWAREDGIGQATLLSGTPEEASAYRASIEDLGKSLIATVTPLGPGDHGPSQQIRTGQVGLPPLTVTCRCIPLHACRCIPLHAVTCLTARGRGRWACHRCCGRG